MRSATRGWSTIVTGIAGHHTDVDLPDRVRTSCARVADQARHVRIDDAALDALARTLGADGLPARVDDAQFTSLGDPGTDIAFAFVVNAVNFGSGWFPVVRKRNGMSGAVTMGANLRDAWERDGVWSPSDLVALDVDIVARTFGQDVDGPAGDLMALFAIALHDLGRLVLDRYDGAYERLIDASGGSAARLAELLTDMPLYGDVAVHHDEHVAFYKRAQLTPAALANTVGVAFDDLDRLTIFADNLVPHVLRVEGVLRYDESLATRIDAEELLPHGSAEEVEIRACGVTACERLAAQLGTRPALLDFVLWNRGQQRRYKAVPRHRTRCPYY
jgi:hypothetical protein